LGRGPVGGDVPDIPGVFGDHPVAGEAAHGGDVEDGAARPGRAVEKRSLHFFLTAGMGVEVGEDQEGVAPGGQCLDDGREVPGILGRGEVPAENLVDGLA
jgi:hypothetical protein